MPLEPGIYFNLSDEAYFSEPCVSTTALKTLLVSAKDFWDASWMNPNKPTEEEKDCFTFGKALHSYVLEPHTISKYASSFAPPAGCIKTVDEIKAFLDSKGEKYKSTMRRQELVDLALQLDPNAPIHDRLEESYYLQNPGKTFLPAEDYGKLAKMKDYIDTEEEFLRIFQDGMAEVTLVCDCPITGIRIKGKLDYLSLHIADLKSFNKKSKQPIDNVVKSAFINERYDIQFYVYKMLRDEVFRGLKDGRYSAHGPHNPAWLQYIVENYNDRFYFGFIESARPHNVKVLDIEQWRRQDEEHNMLFMKAEDSYETAVNKFVHCMNKFGTNTPWREENITITMGDKDLPLYFLESR